MAYVYKVDLKSKQRAELLNAKSREGSRWAKRQKRAEAVRVAFSPRVK